MKAEKKWIFADGTMLSAGFRALKNLDHRERTWL